MGANTVYSFSQLCYRGLIYFRTQSSSQSHAHVSYKKLVFSFKCLRKALHKISRIAVIVVQLLSHHLTLHDPMDCSTLGLPVLRHLPDFAQTHVHVSDAIQPSHPLSPPSHPCPQSFPASGSFPVSRLFTSGGQSTGASASASVLPMNIQD